MNVYRKCANCTRPSGTPIPHTLPLRKNEAAKLAKNFAKRVIPTPQTRFRRLSGEICPKRVPRLLLSAHFEYVSRSSWHRPANSAYVWTKSRPIGAETPFEKQKCTRKSKSSPRARACGTHQHHRMPHALSLRGKRTYNVPTYNWQRLAARVRRCLVAAGERRCKAFAIPVTVTSRIRPIKSECLPARALDRRGFF